MGDVPSETTKPLDTGDNPTGDTPLCIIVNPVIVAVGLFVADNVTGMGELRAGLWRIGS